MSLFQDIYNKLNFVELVSQKTSLTSMGNGKYRGKSPFTNERTPSFYVDGKQKTFYCFSTKKKGGFKHYVEEVYGLEGAEVFSFLAEFCDIDITQYQQKEDPNTRLRKCVKAAKDFFLQYVNATELVAHVESRGIKNPKEVIEDFELGFAPADGTLLIKYLRYLKFTDDEIKTAGLAYYSVTHQDLYARFVNRAVFTVYDNSGQLCGFVGRDVTGNQKAKYLNNPVTPLFERNKVLFNLKKVRGDIRKYDKVSVSEGPWDAIISTLSGFPGVATLGSTISDEQLTTLATFASNVYISYDNDVAGHRGMIEFFEKMERENLDCLVYMVRVPEKDLNDVFEKRGGPEAVVKVIESSQPDTAFAVEYYTQAAMLETKIPAAVSKKVLVKIREVFRDINDLSYRSLDMLDRLSQTLNLDKIELQKYLSKEPKLSHSSAVYNKLRDMEFPAPIYERRVMTEVMKEYDHIHKLRAAGITDTDFSSFLVAKVMNTLFNLDGTLDPFSALEQELTAEELDTVLLAYSQALTENLDFDFIFGIFDSKRLGLRGRNNKLSILGRPLKESERALKKILVDKL